MTKKDYELIANVLTGFQDNSFPVQAKVVGAVSQKLADKLQADNPRFDRQKFLIACGIEQERNIDDPDFELEQLRDAGQLDDLLNS